MSNQITPNPSVPTQVVQEMKFPKMINNLGIIPTSYKDSMSYYECLAWLCKFLEESVIPTLNENGKAVEELQGLYVELNNYVAHYFDTLDVQEEINNKLDDMAEAGTLEEIISAYLNSKAVFGYDTVEDMKEATNLIEGSYARTMGYYEKNDGGSSLYKIRTRTLEDDVDDILLIALDDETLVAELIHNNTLHTKQGGLYGDNTHDDTIQFNKCCEICNNLEINLVIDKGTYKVTDTIEMPTRVTITSENAIINSYVLNGDIISCNRSGYVTGTQPKYTMIGNLRINGKAENNQATGLHIGASKISLFENITITDCYNAGILIKSTYSGDIDNFNLNLCHCYNTGGIVIESADDNITQGSITDGSVRNCVVASPLQKSAITINQISSKSIFGIKFDRNFLNSKNFPVLTINNTSNILINYLEFVENMVEIRNSENNPLYAVITGVSNSIFELQGQLQNTSGFDINNCRNCNFRRIIYTGYYGLNDKIFDIDSNCFNITFENLAIPISEIWFNSSLTNYFGALKNKWNDLFVDNGRNTKIITSLPFTDIITSINKFDNLLSIGTDSPVTNYNLRYATAEVSNNQLNVTLQSGQDSPRIQMPIFNCKSDFVGVHIRYKLTSAFSPTGNARLKLMPFSNFNIIITDTEVDKWYDVMIIAPVSNARTFFGIDGYLNSDLSIVIDKFEIIDGFELPYYNNYNLIEGNQ